MHLLKRTISLPSLVKRSFLQRNEDSDEKEYISLRSSFRRKVCRYDYLYILDPLSKL